MKDLFRKYLDDVQSNGLAKILPCFPSVRGKLYYSREKDSVYLIDGSCTQMYVLPEDTPITCCMYGVEINGLTLKRKLSGEDGKPIWSINGTYRADDGLYRENEEMNGLIVTAFINTDESRKVDMFFLNRNYAFSYNSKIQTFAETRPYAGYREFRSLDKVLGYFDDKLHDIFTVYIMHILKDIPIDEEILEMVMELVNQCRAFWERYYTYKDCIRSMEVFLTQLEYHAACARGEKPCVAPRDPEVIGYYRHEYEQWEGGDWT